MQARDLITLCAALASISTASAQSYYFYTNYSAVINYSSVPGPDLHQVRHRLLQPELRHGQL